MLSRLIETIETISDNLSFNSINPACPPHQKGRPFRPHLPGDPPGNSSRSTSTPSPIHYIPYRLLLISLLIDLHDIRGRRHYH